MDKFVQAAALVLIAVVLALTLGKLGKDISMLLVIAACVMVMVIGLEYLEPVMDFLMQLEALGNLDSGMLSILFKVVGIGILSEVAGMICTDSGNGSLGKVLQIAGTAVILWLSIPIFQVLLELIQDILGEI